MKIFEIIKQVITMIIRKVLKKKINKNNSMEPAKMNTGKRYLFNEKQLIVLDRGAELGFDIEDIAKTKYKAEQMLILLYAKMLGINSSSFNSFSMSAIEMEYNLYLATIDKYLGNKYLKRLLNEGKFSIQDAKIKSIIDEELLKHLDSYQEIAASSLTVNEHTEKQQYNIEYYNMLVKMCKDRDIPFNNLRLGTVYDRFSMSIFRNSLRICDNVGSSS